MLRCLITHCWDPELILLIILGAQPKLHFQHCGCTTLFKVLRQFQRNSANRVAQPHKFNSWVTQPRYRPLLDNLTYTIKLSYAAVNSHLQRCLRLRKPVEASLTILLGRFQF